MVYNLVLEEHPLNNADFSEFKLFSLDQDSFQWVQLILYHLIDSGSKEILRFMNMKVFNWVLPLIING